ncbi:MAG: GatB/YqeY domain-containing protein [Candidatus Liptonbacteria bacterium]|nr:GatB/YqeY domain-containing protein [Candidatus Liptonbacteria bacterium]
MGKNLKEKLRDEAKESLLKRNAEKTGVLRFLLSLLQNREIEKRGTGQSPMLGDEEVIEILQREVKKRKEAIELFRKGGRPELVEKETKELVFINEYLPPQMQREEIVSLVSGLKEKGLNDFNSLMKEAAKATKGLADGKLVSEIVREILK